MSNFGESYGRDLRLDIMTPTGILTFAEITDIDLKPRVHEDSFTLIDGTVIDNMIPQGGTGTISIKRTDATLETFWAQFEAGYYAGARQMRGTITETISNPDGSISEFQCQGVTLKVEDLGAWKGDNAVTQSLSFKYQRYIQIQ